MVSPVHGDYRRCQAEIPLIILCRFPGPALSDLGLIAALCIGVLAFFVLKLAGVI
jgi:hypothetical protein